MQVPQITKDCLLKLLDKVVSICDEYGLCYYLAGGSVLGAIRHKGFIPWDDDIDIYLFREDYEKLLTLPDEIWGDEFRLAYYTNTPKYTYDFIKIELTNTTIIERLHPNYHGRVFLDVFPLDFVSNNQQKRQEEYTMIRSIMNEVVETYIKNDCDCLSIWELIALKWKRFFNRDKNLLYKYDKLTNNKPDSKFTEVASHHGPWEGGPLPYTYFGEGIYAEFEGKQYRIPKLWDAYLTYRYGNYMQLPSEDKRIAHNFDFADYERRISDEEAEKIFKKLHKKYSYHFSLKREIKIVYKMLKNKLK